jgi:phospholipid transport system transporter-binding protein
MARGDAAAPAWQLTAAGDARYELSGCAGFSTARALLLEGKRLFASQPSVVVDLGGVTATDSAGLAVLLCWLAEARQGGRLLTLHNLPAALRAIARISDVEAMLTEA